MDTRYIASVDMSAGTIAINDGKPTREGDVLIWHLRPSVSIDTDMALVNGIVMVDVQRGEEIELWDGSHRL